MRVIHSRILKYCLGPIVGVHVVASMNAGYGSSSAGTIPFTGNSGVTPPQTSAALSLDSNTLNPDYALMPPELDFGSLRYDSAPELEFCIVNTGDAQVQIQNPISITPSSSTMSGEFTVVRIRRPSACGGASVMDVPLPQTLGVGQLLEVTVRADPVERTGVMQATLTVNSNLATNPTRTLTLLGNATSAMFTLAPSSTIDFGAVDVQGMEQSRTVTITNNGNSALDLRNVLRMANPGFTVLLNGIVVPTTMPGLSVTVAASGGTATVTAKYKPTIVSTGESITLRHDIVGALAGPPRRRTRSTDAASIATSTSQSRRRSPTPSATPEIRRRSAPRGSGTPAKPR